MWMHHGIDLIPVERTPTLPDLFRTRLERSPNSIAYWQFAEDRAPRWEPHTWSQAAHQAAQWQAALRRENLKQGARVAICMPNRMEWVLFDMACMSLGLVVVPLYPHDRPEAMAYILEDAGVQLLLMEDESQWRVLEPHLYDATKLKTVVILQGHCSDSCGRCQAAGDWLPQGTHPWLRMAGATDPDGLATLVYTSGTTGPPKGVMLSHRNILFNAAASLKRIDAYTDDRFLSFLPLSHALERTAGCYLPMMAGCEVAFSRGIPYLSEDLAAMQPTVLISVPRIFERIHSEVLAKLQHAPHWKVRLFSHTVESGWDHFLHQQGKSGFHFKGMIWPLLKPIVANKLLKKLGGRLRLAVSGGAPLDPTISRFFLGMGLPLVQGYGLTETAPVVSVNTPTDNEPSSVGQPLPGVKVRLNRQGELCVKGPGVMTGYWHDPGATHAAIDQDGWYHTGDKGEIDAEGHIKVVGRIKEILVTATGRKVPPADVEGAIQLDPLFNQVMVLGEGRAYLAALVVLNPEVAEGKIWDEVALVARINELLHGFPRYAEIIRVAVVEESWTVDNGLLTPTLKLKRRAVLNRYQTLIEQLYQGH
ncbi:AMP-dependent synthetase/ligase [Magnetococcus sp. PR-3]|uniref:AMP-dependent synthetase/ligase n=1 Tax=Magnetococcus sp. PR-3 TaxID=3120355 RepID=UPI002FCE45EE